MPVIWNTPPAFTYGGSVTAADMTKLSDDLTYLMEKPDTQIIPGSGTDFTTSSTSYQNVTGMVTSSLTKRSSSSRLLVILRGAFHSTVGAQPIYGFNINTVDYDCGYSYLPNTSSLIPYIAVFTGIAAGAVTVQLRLKSSGGSVGFYGGTSRQMIVIEGSV